MKKYEGVKKFILDKIEKNEYQLDSAIPSERELATITGVNRMTVRRAIEDLVVDGILITKIGCGTFVINDKKKGSLIINEKENSKKSIKIISSKKTSGSNVALKALNLNSEDEYWRIRRIRKVENIPYVYEDIYLDSRYFKEITEEDLSMELEDLSKKHVMEKIMGRIEVESLICLKNTSVLLKVPEGSPILQIKTTYDINGTPILFCRSNYPGYTYKYEGAKFEI